MHASRTRFAVCSAALLALAAGTLAFTSHTDSTPSVIKPGPHAEPAAPLADHPVARMVGYWVGTASSLGRDGEMHEASAVERARWNLAGTAILVEGYGYFDNPDTGERTVGHDAFGFIEWNAKTEAPVFFAHRIGGGFESHPITYDEDTDTLGWSMVPAPGTKIQFSITLTETRWHEFGRMTRDGGTTWTTFIETDLTRETED